MTNKVTKLWYILVLVNTLQSCISYQPCLVLPDHFYKGNVINCSLTGISSTDIASLNFRNVSTLILSNNDVRKLRNSSFLHFNELKRLECVSCNLSLLEVNALKGLETLEVLLLNNNSLQIINHAFPIGFFDNVPHLYILNIGTNDNDGDATSYEDFIDIFDKLHDLSQLVIDSFRKLRIGGEFAKLKNLKTLNITCNNLVTMNNESLLGLNVSNVKHFSLINGVWHTYENQDCDMLFQNLPNVSTLTLENMKFGNEKILNMLQPLQSRHLDLIYLDNVGIYTHKQRDEERVYDRIITDQMMRYLKNVCVTNFVWIRNYAISVEFEEITSSRWRYCLKKLTFVSGGARIYTHFNYLFNLVRLQNMESFIFMVHGREETHNFWTQNIRTDAPRGWVGSFPRYTQGDSNGMSAAEGFLGNNFTTHHPKISEKQKSPGNNTLLTSYAGNPSRMERETPVSKNKFYMDKNGFSNPVHNILLFPPPLLTNLVLDGGFSFDMKMNVSKNNSLRSIALRYWVDGYKPDKLRTISGLDHVEALDFTSSPLRSGPLFFTWFPKLKKVVMRNTNPNPGFLAHVAETVPKLEYFDIAENRLEWLPKNMFHNNRNLKYLCIALNRFTRIPFDLSLTPNLEILDLRENSLDLNHHDRQSLDRHHFTRGLNNFKVLFSHNQISCACSALSVLQWLQQSKINFDNDKNYICMTQEGDLSETSKFSDIRSFWRKCFGQSCFLISLILASTIIGFNLATFLVIMHKTRIVSKIMQMVVPEFRLKTRRDFRFDVVLGYADQNGSFIREVLLPYLEVEWGLRRTFVHQRDLLQDPQLMSYALRDSWRTLLVITEDFLDRHIMAYNVMKVSAFFVHPTNPRNVVVIVEDRVQNRIPDFVLQVVDEDSIIVLPELTSTALDPGTVEILKKCLV